MTFAILVARKYCGLERCEDYASRPGQGGVFACGGPSV
jgi:hypothetical protein